MRRRARELAEHAVNRTASEAESLWSALGTWVLGAFFAMLTMHFMLRTGRKLRCAQETFPLRPDYTRGLFSNFAAWVAAP